MSQLALLREPQLRRLFLATLGSGVGTYLAAIALTVDVFDRTGSGAWVSALLIVEFLPVIVIGLTAGPLIDRLSRRGLMIVSDLARFVVFAALPFVDSPGAIVALAGIAGVATGLFRPAVLAGMPNLVPDAELPSANSLFQGVENLAWMIGPLLAGVLLAISGPASAYWANAVTFLVSAALLARIPARLLRSEERVTKGHWRDLREGFALVLGSRALVTVLVVWSIVSLGNAGFNVAEVALAKSSLGAGDLGFAAIVGASGLGLTIGSFLANRALDRFGRGRTYAGSIALLAAGVGGAAISPSIWLVLPLVVLATAGNGIAVVANILLVQRGAPDRFRGRVFTVLQSTTYAVLGLGMAAAGVLTNTVGPRWVWGGAALTYLLGAVVAAVLGRDESFSGDARVDAEMPQRVRLTA